MSSSESGRWAADVIVLGAGPAGLGAAYRAAALGRRVVVLERSAKVGGLAGSFDVEGIRVDYGSHRLHPATPPHILRDLKDLLGADLQERPRNGRIYLEGRWIRFPLRAPDLLMNLPRSFALSAALDGLLSWRRRAGDGASFADVLLAGLGPTMCERFYFPYARKLWGLDPEQIHAEQARRRVAGSAVGKLLRKVTTGAASPGIFYYPRYGFGQLWDALAAACADRGAQVRLRSPVRSLEYGRQGWLVVLETGETLRSPRVWSTLPMPALARTIRPRAPEEVLEAAGRLGTRAMLLVYVTLAVDRYTAYDAHYVPGLQTPVARISEPKNYRNSEEAPGRTVLCAEIPCSTDGSLWTASDDQLGVLVVDALRGMGLPDAIPNNVHVERLPSAYPVYDLEYPKSFETVAAWIDSNPGLLSFGRHGAFVHNNSHHALEMGWEAAQSLGPDGVFNLARWQCCVADFSRHVVED